MHETAQNQNQEVKLPELGWALYRIDVIAVPYQLQHLEIFPGLTMNLLPNSGPCCVAKRTFSLLTLGQQDSPGTVIGKPVHIVTFCFSLRLLLHGLKMADIVPNIVPITTFKSKKPGGETMIASLLSRPDPLSERNGFLRSPH